MAQEFTTSTITFIGLKGVNGPQGLAGTTGPQGFQGAIGPINLGEYGTGIDGSLTFNGSTTILGMVPVSNVYTLVADIFPSSMTINNGVTIASANYQIFCTGTLTNNGIIDNSGQTSTSQTGGNAVSPATIGSNAPLFIVGGNAGNGGNGSKTIGVDGDALGQDIGGNGGNGGTGTSGHTGGAGGVNVPPSNQFGLPQVVNYLPTAITLNSLQAFSPLYSGGGGGGGGGDSTNFGGGGGAGGGLIMICAKTLTGTGAINANGGNGFSPTTGNCGGGGGGGGGVISVISSNDTTLTSLTFSVAGGSGGTKIGTGINGTAGSAGTLSRLIHG